MTSQESCRQVQGSGKRSVFRSRRAQATSLRGAPHTAHTSGSSLHGADKLGGNASFSSRIFRGGKPFFPPKQANMKEESYPCWTSTWYAQTPSW